MIRVSQAFAAFRQAVIEELKSEIQNQLIPTFNAEIADIEAKYKETTEAAANAHTPNASEALLRVAMRNKEARLLGLQLRRQQFLNEIQTRLRMEVGAKLSEYGGETFEEEETNSNNKTRVVSKARFPDGSIAKIPGHVFVDWNQFYTL